MRITFDLTAPRRFPATRRLAAAMGLLVSFESCRTSGSTSGESELNDVAAVQTSVASSVSDGVFDAADVAAAFSSAGNTINAEEGLAIWKAIRQPSGYTVPAEAVVAGEQRALFLGLPQDQQNLVTSRRTLAGTVVPEAVRKVLIEARLAGAVAYDVQDPDPNDPNEGYWSPYPQGIPAQQSMEWKYTEITPDKLQADMSATAEEDRIAGEDSATGNVTYAKDKCLNGRGSITANYDELSHPNIYARGRSCQKWANNCGILL